MPPFNQFDRVRLLHDGKHWRIGIPSKWVSLLGWQQGDLLQIALSSGIPTVPPALAIVNIAQVTGKTAENIKAAFNLTGFGIDHESYSDWILNEADKIKKAKRSIEQEANSPDSTHRTAAEIKESWIPQSRRQKRS